MTFLGYLYAIGGFGNGNYLETVERYDVNADAWTDVAPMKNARRWFAAVVLNELIYVIGWFKFQLFNRNLKS